MYLAIYVRKRDYFEARNEMKDKDKRLAIVALMEEINCQHKELLLTDDMEFDWVADIDGDEVEFDLAKFRADKLVGMGFELLQRRHTWTKVRLSNKKRKMASAPCS